MIMLLDTSTPTCFLTLIDADDARHDYAWEAGRSLARDGLAYIRDRLAEHNATIQDLSGLGVMRGPGSFTGLRIGCTMANTLADSLNVPIVGVMGEQWQMEACERLKAGENDRLVMPYYGGEATITTPRK